MKTPAELQAAALSAERAGDTARALELAGLAAAAAPTDGALLNSVGGLLMRAGQPARAAELFARAVASSPQFDEARINLAIALTAAGRPREAVAAIVPAEQGAGGAARYWSVRGTAERADGQLAAAAASYDRALHLEPAQTRALHGRARVALERQEPDAADLFATVVGATPQDAEAWLGYAQALIAAGRSGEAEAIADALVRDLPAWPPGLELKAQMRWDAGDREAFCAHYPGALAQADRDPAVVRSWARQLAGAERFAEGAEVAARARRERPDAQLALLEAVHAGEAGDDDRAEAIFAALALDSDDRLAHEARHWLRRRDPARAEALLARLLTRSPGHIGGWALRDLAWRLLGDSRHMWLHGAPGLIGYRALPLSADALARAIELLRELHARAAQPIGQSVRRGTQTRGGLFDRSEPELAALRGAIVAALEDYRAELPATDPTHPLLAHRGAPWRIRGSWSIRLTEAGWHTEHIHPAGIVSSAAYLVVPPPDPDAPAAGALELGRPPPDLRLDLPPLATLPPATGYLALFPSTLYHGTRRFGRGQRMSVAFDVGLA